MYATVFGINKLVVFKWAYTKTIHSFLWDHEQANLLQNNKQQHAMLYLRKKNIHACCTHKCTSHVPLFCPDIIFPNDYHVYNDLVVFERWDG